jgi:predicted  nucleic acid-binding Zn-ribbon protein
MAGYKQHMASLKAKMGVSATKDEAWAYCTIKKLMDMACDKAPEPVGILNEQSIVQLIDEGVKRGIEPLLDGKWKVTYRNAIDLNTEIKRLQEFGKEKQSEVVRCKMEIERLTKDLMYQQQTVSPEEARLQGRVKALEKENEVYASQNGKMLKEKREHLNRIHGLTAHNKGLRKKVKELEDQLEAVMVRDGARL